MMSDFAFLVLTICPGLTVPEWPHNLIDAGQLEPQSKHMMRNREGPNKTDALIKTDKRVLLVSQ